MDGDTSGIPQRASLFEDAGAGHSSASRAKRHKRQGAFYQGALKPDEAAAYAEALGKTGLSDEVALIRAKLRTLLDTPGKSDAPHLAEVLRTVDVLVRALRVDKQLGEGDETKEQFIERVLRTYERRKHTEENL
jgi:hypothetical protein